MASEQTLFDKIVSKQIPAEVVFEDELCLAFKDISPQGPVHVLVIPKDRDGLSQLSKAEPRHKELLGHLLFVAQQVAKEQGLEDGFRVCINDGRDGCQTVYHLHLHVIGGRQLGWPPG
jgi:histidine triad (HIT) family protein